MIRSEPVLPEEKGDYLGRALPWVIQFYLLGTKVLESNAGKIRLSLVGVLLGLTQELWEDQYLLRRSVKG